MLPPLHCDQCQSAKAPASTALVVICTDQNQYTQRVAVIFDCAWRLRHWLNILLDTLDVISLMAYTDQTDDPVSWFRNQVGNHGCLSNRCDSINHRLGGSPNLLRKP